jgi:hypothetical protein
MEPVGVEEVSDAEAVGEEALQLGDFGVGEQAGPPGVPVIGEFQNLVLARGSVRV